MAAKATTKMAGLQCYGERKVAALDSVSKNNWNPNKMSDLKYQSLKQDMRDNGWVESQPLLIWRTDERGRIKNLIIDGEHRWMAAIEVGFTKGPMVFLDKLTRAQAIELTVKLDNNRGSFEKDSIGAVLRELVPLMKVESPALALGFSDVELNKMLALPAVDLEGDPAEGERSGAASGIDGVTSTNSITKMVPLYFEKATHEAFISKVKELGQRWQVETVTEVVQRCVDEAYARKK